MDNKDKIIEEMAEILLQSSYAWWREAPNGTTKKEYQANTLYNAGYRKITDSVVLSREEYEKLTAPRLFIKPRELNQKELAEKLKNEKYGIIGVDSSSIEIIPTRAEIEKETAEKFVKEVDDCMQSSDLSRIMAYRIKQLAKQFGVEIKE